MGDWRVGSLSTDIGGRFEVVITGRGQHGRPCNVTLLRNAPTQITSYADADPFGDATCELNFPALTPFDDLQAPDLSLWLMEGAAVDLFWKPSLPMEAPGYHSEAHHYPRRSLDPLTERRDIITPWARRDAASHILGDRRIKVWEGFIASIKASATQASFGIPVTCQGALFQLDRFRAAPFYPPDPWPMETLIADQFNVARRPQLRTKALMICFPDTWRKKIPDWDRYGNTPIAPHGHPGDLWSGLSTRNTGSWNPALTGYVQDLLTVMITRPGEGVRPGNQWTVQHYRRGQALPDGLGRSGEELARGGTPSGGRRPVLQIRNRFAPATFSLWLGEPGVEADLDRDSTQAVDVIYGDGIDVNGQQWRNATVNDNGTRWSYAPLAFDHSVYPYTAAHRNSDKMPLEGYTNYGNGFSFTDGVTIAEQQLGMNMNPGWQGTISLRIDPSPELSRWQIHSGMVLALKGFMGTGEAGMRFHIAQCTHSPQDGTVNLTVDTRFRDLLTVEQSLERTRDPLTPVKMLQVGLASTLVEDVQAPWDYSAGSGFVPRESRKFFNLKPDAVGFPWVEFTRKYPPSTYPQYYTECHAGAPTAKGRWTQRPTQVITSARGTIARTEFVCVDYYGRPKKIPFHVSFYYNNGVRTWSMPHKDGDYSPFALNHFEKVNPITGTGLAHWLYPDNSFIVGWGNKVSTLAYPNGEMDRPGFWPYGEKSGHSPTGLFMDDFVWDYDLTDKRGYFTANNPPGKHWKDTDVSLYAMFYAEANENVYFIGRLYRENPGAV